MKKSELEYRPDVGPCEEFLSDFGSCLPSLLTEEDIIGMLKSKNKYVRMHVEGLIYHTKDKKLRVRRGWLMYRVYHPRMPVEWCTMCAELTFDEWYGKEKERTFSYTNDDGKARARAD